MKIAILGGSFDPPHIGHLLIAQQVKERLEVDQIWLMVVPNHPFAKKMISIEHRMAMATLLQKQTITVSDFEITHNPQGYTIDTLRLLKQHYPDDTFSWITGSDQLYSFQKYKEWRSIIAENTLIIFPRETVIERLSEKTKQAFGIGTLPKTVTLLTDPDLILTNISSTLVRKRLAKKQSVDYIIPDTVARYIAKNNLYQNNV